MRDYRKEAIRIPLSEADIGQMRELAKVRVREKFIERTGIPAFRSTEKMTEDYFVGLLGECAVGKYLGLPVDDSWLRYGDKQDFILPNGPTAEVRCRTLNEKQRMGDFAPYGDRIEDFRTDIGVLTWARKILDEDGHYVIKPDIIYFIGWTTKEHFIEHHQVVDFAPRGSGKTISRVSIRPERMFSPKTFIKYVYGEVA